MGTTPIYGWPYGESDSSPAGHTQDRALAEAIETTVKALETDLKNLPIAYIEQSTAQNLTTGATTILNLQAKLIDTSGMHNPAVNPSRLTATVPGWYLAAGAVSSTGSNAGRRGTSWAKNGAAYGNALLLPPPPTSVAEMPLPTVLIYLAVGDYLEARMFHDAGVQLTTYVAGGNRTYVIVECVSRTLAPTLLPTEPIIPPEIPTPMG